MKMRPFEPGIERARALYRIPPVAPSGRTLEVCMEGQSILSKVADWPGEERSICVLHQANTTLPDEHFDGSASNVTVHHATLHGDLPFGKNTFDLIILHGTLDQLPLLAEPDNPISSAEKLIARLTALLGSEGILAGCVQNRSSIKNSLRRVAWLFKKPAGPAGTPRPRNWPLSALSCYRVAERGGLVNIKMFGLVPNRDAPIKAFQIEPKISRSIAKRQLFGLKPPLVSRPHYAIRRLLAETGVGHLVDESIFFWGKKP